VAVDLSRSIRALMDGACQRAEAASKGHGSERAAAAYDEAARFALQYAECASTTSEKKSRLEAAVRFRSLAEECRSTPRSTDSQRRVPEAVPGDDSDFGSAVAGLIHKSTVTWDDIAGLDQTKQSIKTAYALSLAQAPEGVALSPVRNILFHGPPGCGKSLLAAATSNGLEATFFNVKVSSLLSKYFGESPKLVSSVYEAARQCAPSVVFLDEVDALATSREQNDSGAERRVLANLLSELDGVADKEGDRFVLTIAATNTPWSLDAAIISRFERQVYIPLPDAAARARILELQLTSRGYEVELPISQLADRTEGLSGRELERFAKQMTERMIAEANPGLADLAVRGRRAIEGYQVQIRPLSRRDVDVVLATMSPQTSREQIERYEQWNAAG